MIKFKTIATGSQGNGYVLTDGITTLILEAGISVERFDAEDIYNCEGVLVSHEHQDHSRYAKSFNNQGITVYSSLGTLLEINTYDDEELHNYEETQIHTMNVQSIDVSHDAMEPIGYRIRNNFDEKILFLTDLGTIDNVVGLTKEEWDLVVIELNYDRKTLLANTSYQGQRSSGTTGHLGLRETKKFVEKIGKETPVIFIHMSGTNLDRKLVEREFEGYNWRFATPGDELEIGFPLRRF